MLIDDRNKFNRKNEMQKTWVGTGMCIKKISIKSHKNLIAWKIPIKKLVGKREYIIEFYLKHLWKLSGQGKIWENFGLYNWWCWQKDTFIARSIRKVTDRICWKIKRDSKDISWKLLKDTRARE